MKTLLLLGAKGGTRPRGCIEGAASGRTWDEKGACTKENEAAAGGRKRGSPARLAKVGGEANDEDKVSPRAIVEGTVNARGMCVALREATGESPRIVLLDCGRWLV